MPASDESSLERRYWLFAWVITGLFVALLVWLSYLHWPDIRSASIIDIAKCLGGVGTFLALVWLIAANHQQTARFKATMRATGEQIESTYRGSLQPAIVFRNVGASEWKMFNAGKGVAINVDVFGAEKDKDWDKSTSTRFPAIPVGHEVPLGFLSMGRQWRLLAQYTDTFGREFTSKCENSTNWLRLEHEHPELHPAHSEWELDPKNENRFRSELTEGAM